VKATFFMTSQTIPSTIVLHLGAHKTASTHLQHAIMGALPLDGVTFAGPQTLRNPGGSLPERFGFPFDPETAQVSDLSPRDALVQLADGAERLVLSEETFAGKLQRGWGRIPTPLYFTAPDRVAQFGQIIADAGGPPLDLCLGIRNPTDFLGSAYSQILNGNRVIMPDKYRDKNPFEIVDWADYITRLRATAGVGSLTVWRFEDYADLFGDICHAMVGTRAITPPDERMQPRLSEKAVDAILLAKSFTGPDFKREAAETLPITAENPPYDLYDPQTHAESRALYAAQCATIASLPNVTFLQK
jgi:hypothetical protein